MPILDIAKYNSTKSLKDYEDLTDIAYSKLFLKSTVKTNSNNLIVNSTSLGNKYHDYLIQYTYIKTFTEEEMYRYKYSPKLFCYETYGTVELWGLLLQINNMTSCSEFTKNTIRIFNDSVFDVINEILEVEDDKIQKNKKDNDL